jgi:GTP-binding protein
VEDWRRRLGAGVPVIATSAASGAGLDELTAELLRLVAPEQSFEGAPGASGVGAEAAAPARDEMAAALAEHMVFRPRPREGFHVERLSEGVFAVRGRGIERLVQRFDLDNEDALAHLEQRLRTIGVIKELEAHGFEPGDEIEIAGVTFELDPR